MTVTDRSDASEQEFRDRIAAFDTAPTPPEVREAAVVEEVARAINRSLDSDDPIDWMPRALAAAAVAAYRAQDGGAEEAVRRVEAVAVELDAEADDPSIKPQWSDALRYAASGVRAALAPQASR